MYSNILISILLFLSYSGYSQNTHNINVKSVENVYYFTGESKHKIIGHTMNIYKIYVLDKNFKSLLYVLMNEPVGGIQVGELYKSDTVKTKMSKAMYLELQFVDLRTFKDVK